MGKTRFTVSARWRGWSVAITLLLLAIYVYGAAIGDWPQRVKTWLIFGIVIVQGLLIVIGNWRARLTQREPVPDETEASGSE